MMTRAVGRCPRPGYVIIEQWWPFLSPSPSPTASLSSSLFSSTPTFLFIPSRVRPQPAPSRRRCRSPRVLLPVHVWLRYQPRMFRPRRLSSSGGVSLHPQIRRKLVIVGDGTWVLPLLPRTRSSPVPIRRMRKDVLALLVRPRRVPQGICECNQPPRALVAHHSRAPPVATQ